MSILSQCAQQFGGSAAHARIGMSQIVGKLICWQGRAGQQSRPAAQRGGLDARIRVLQAFLCGVNQFNGESFEGLTGYHRIAVARHHTQGREAIGMAVGSSLGPHCGVFVQQTIAQRQIELGAARGSSARGGRGGAAHACIDVSQRRGE